MASGTDGRLTPDSLGAGGLLAILLFVLLSLLIGVRLLPLVAVVALGTDGPIAALKRTFRLTSGQFWRLLGFFLMLALAFFVA